MKKYQQLFLAALTIFSFSCFLIYRHEYYKLRYVLEVLNFFGTPGASTVSPPVCIHNTTFNKPAFHYAEPQPVWQRVSNTLYIYSAYWGMFDDREKVKAFAVGVLNENLNYGCYLWFDTYPKTRKGQFSFSGIPVKSQNPLYIKGYGKSKTKAFVFYCEGGPKDVKPVGVTFYKTSANDTFQGFLPVADIESGPPLVNSTGVCVMPTPFPSYNRSTYLEFLSFHLIVGVNTFIVYGANDQHRLFSSIPIDSSLKIDIKLLQWNYPYFGDIELMKVIAENDCITKTSGLVENVIILEWNKLLVPHIVSSVNKQDLFSISNLLNYIDQEKKTYKFQLSTLLFCTEYEDDKAANFSSSVLFKKTRYSLPKYDMSVPVFRPYLRSGRSQKIGKDIIAVHQYTSCRNTKIKSGEKKSDKIDRSIYKFKYYILNSKLLHGKSFN